MLLTPAQKEIAKDKHRFRVLNCGRRFGKTTEAIEEIKRVALAAKEDDKICYIAPTYQQARDIAWESMKRELRPIIIKVNESRLELEVQNKDGKRVSIMLRGWEAIETLRGQNFVFLVIDEVASMRNFWAGWNEVLSPTLIDRKGDALFISTPKGFNHFYDLYNLELTNPDFKSFHFTSYDNPHLPVEEIEREKSTKPPDTFAQEYLADFKKTQGLVYKEFDREKHLYDEEFPPELLKRFRFVAGVDFGFRNPAAVLSCYWTGERLLVFDEWYKRERTDIQIAEYVAAHRFQEVYPDPENQGAIEELRRLNVNVREVVKGKGSIKSGIDSIREMLIRGDLLINKRCVNLISEFETYSYDDDKVERNEDENPIKANDHALDALRYVVSTMLPVIQRNTFIANTPRFYPKTPKNPAL